MKKTMILLLAAMAMASCSDKKDEPQVTPDPEPTPTPTPDPEPEPTLAELIVGDWVYDHLELGTRETHKYLANGVFYFSNRNAVYNFTNENVDGTYTIDGNRITAQVKIAGVSTQMKMLMTACNRYSFTADFNDGSTVANTLTYARLLETATLTSGQSHAPDYAALAKDPVTGYASHNVLVATVDDKGAISAHANGLTYIDVVTEKGTAAIEVKVSGNADIFGDYSFAFGKTVPGIIDLIGDRYYYREDNGGLSYIVDQDVIDCTQYITGTEDDTHVTFVRHMLNKTMSTDEIKAWLDANYTRIPSDDILGYLTGMTDAQDHPVAAVYDAAKSTLTFMPLTPQGQNIAAAASAVHAKAAKLPLYKNE